MLGRILDTRLGRVLVIEGARGLAALAWADDGDEAALESVGEELGEAVELGDSAVLRKAARQLVAYLSGTRRGFELPLQIDGTPFQHRVWEALTHIPYGETATYAELAGRIGKPAAVRAVGHACAKNPLPIIIPCHRVLSSDGGLGGYVGGLARKRKLLALERRDHHAGLPLFELAERQVAGDTVRAAWTAASSALDRTLSQWLHAKLDGEPVLTTAWLDPIGWVERAVADTAPVHLAALADMVARSPQTARSPELFYVAQELVIAAAVHVDGWPDEAAIRFALRAAVAMNAGWLVDAVGRRLAERPRLPRKLGEALSEFYQRVMEGAEPASDHIKQRVVDLWLALQASTPGSSWSAVTTADPSASFAAAGLWREAAMAAEQQLASGDGDRPTLLARLVDAYEELGDLETARERLTALMAEDDSPDWTSRMRALSDRQRDPD